MWKEGVPRASLWEGVHTLLRLSPHMRAAPLNCSQKERKKERKKELRPWAIALNKQVSPLANSSNSLTAPYPFPPRPFSPCSYR